jgi:hypothetical protein
LDTLHAATRIAACAVVAALSSHAGLGVAQDARPVLEPTAGTWMLGLAAEGDENSNNSLLANVNWGVTPSTWLNFTTSRSTSSTNRADVKADSIVVGVDHRFESVGIAFNAEDWGEHGVLETRDYRGSVYVDRERFRVAVTYEDRSIDIPFTVTGPLGRQFSRTVNVPAHGVALDARVTPTALWTIYLSAGDYDFERDLSALPRIGRFNLLSTSTLTLANSFVDRVRMIGMEREFGAVAFNLSFMRDRSAVDGSILDTTSAAVLFPVGRRFDLEVQVGDGRSDLFGTGLYAGLSFLVYGR